MVGGGRVGEKRSMVETIIRRRKNWIGHIMRGDGLMKEVMEGKMEGKRGPGRKRIGMIDDLIEKERYGDMKRRAEDRQGWRVWLPGTCRMAEHWRRRAIKSMIGLTQSSCRSKQYILEAQQMWGSLNFWWSEYEDRLKEAFGSRVKRDKRIEIRYLCHRLIWSNIVQFI